MEQTPKKAPGKNTLGQFEQGVRDEKYMVPELTLSHIRVRLFFFCLCFSCANHAEANSYEDDFPIGKTFHLRVPCLKKGLEGRDLTRPSATINDGQWGESCQ